MRTTFGEIKTAQTQFITGFKPFLEMSVRVGGQNPVMKTFFSI